MDYLWSIYTENKKQNTRFTLKIKKGPSAQALLDTAEFPSLKEVQMFVQIEINTVFLVLKFSQNQATIPD